jgi:hypothetical protein
MRFGRLVGVEPSASKCARRDLVAGLAAALQRRGIRLIVYLPAGAFGGDPAAVKGLVGRTGHIATANSR